MQLTWLKSNLSRTWSHTHTLIVFKQLNCMNIYIIPHQLNTYYMLIWWFSQNYKWFILPTPLFCWPLNTQFFSPDKFWRTDSSDRPLQDGHQVRVDNVKWPEFAWHAAATSKFRVPCDLSCRFYDTTRWFFKWRLDWKMTSIYFGTFENWYGTYSGLEKKVFPYWTMGILGIWSQFKL